jgi:hypothetical protein
MLDCPDDVYLPMRYMKRRSIQPLRGRNFGAIYSDQGQFCGVTAAATGPKQRAASIMAEHFGMNNACLLGGCRDDGYKSWWVAL